MPSMRGEPRGVGASGERRGAAIPARLTLSGIVHAYDGQNVLRGMTSSWKRARWCAFSARPDVARRRFWACRRGRDAVAGRILLDDREVVGPERFVPPEERGMGLMFQDYALFPHLDVLQNVLFGLRALPAKDAQTAAAAGLSRVGMESTSMPSRTCCPAESNSGSRWPAPLRRGPA